MVVSKPGFACREYPQERRDISQNMAGGAQGGLCRDLRSSRFSAVVPHPLGRDHCGSMALKGQKVAIVVATYACGPTILLVFIQPRIAPGHRRILSQMRETEAQGIVLPKPKAEAGRDPADVNGLCPTQKPTFLSWDPRCLQSRAAPHPQGAEMLPLHLPWRRGQPAAGNRCRISFWPYQSFVSRAL